MKIVCVQFIDILNLALEYLRIYWRKSRDTVPLYSQKRNATTLDVVLSKLNK